MKILVVSDSFKGSMSSKEVGMTICDYYRNHNLKAVYLPISDGGEGFLDAINYSLQLEKEHMSVEDANFNNTEASYIIDQKNKIAYLELAQAIGLAKLDKDELNALYASSFGFGHLMKEIILKYKIKKIIIGIGGSATSDLGCGMLEALGVEFIDKDGFLIKKMCNAKLMKVKKIRTKSFEQLIKGIDFITLNDVTNPLLGTKGSIATFAKQKGASDNQLFLMEQNLSHIFKLLKNHYQENLVDFEGAGAAGGIGFIMRYFFNSEIKSGIDSILKMINFKQLVKEYDVIFTGEGCLDSQSLDGKVISGIKKYHPQRLIIICGQNKLIQAMKDVYSIVPTVATIEESLNNPISSLKKLLPLIKL